MVDVLLQRRRYPNQTIVRIKKVNCIYDRDKLPRFISVVNFIYYIILYSKRLVHPYKIWVNGSGSKIQKMIDTTTEEHLRRWGKESNQATSNFRGTMWVPVAFFFPITGLLIQSNSPTRNEILLSSITISNTSTNKVCRRRRRRCDIDHRRIGAGTVRVASDQGCTDRRCDTNFFHHRNRSR